MYFENPEKLRKRIKDYRGKIILETYKVDKRRKRVLLTLSLIKNGEIEENIAVETDKEKIPTLVKVIEENWSKVVKEQHPKVKIFIEELKKEKL